MDREKQINEIAKIIARRSMAFRNPNVAFMTTARKTADSIYNADYRKQSELISCSHEKGSEWISVDERLPEDGVWVLGYSAKSGRGGLCNCLKSYIREFGNYDDTTHWLPLPEFPKKKGE